MYASVSGGNNVLVRDGGLLETSGDGSGYTLVTYAGTGGNTISNVGGIYQFTSASSQLYVSGGPIAITDGTISFRGITNANVNAKDSQGDTPWHLAAAVKLSGWRSGICSKVFVELLLSHGADVTAKNNNGQTPLDFATQVEHTNAVAELLRQHIGK